MPTQVPKFIEREPRIVGPLTIKQFAYLGTAGAATFAAFFLIENMLFFLPLAAIFISIGVSLAFVKVNGKSFPSLIWAMITFTTKPQQYVWKKKGVTSAMPQKIEVVKEEEQTKPFVPSSGLKKESKVRDLATKIETS